MTAVEIGQAAGQRDYLRLSDAMDEANGEGKDEGGDSGAPVRRVREDGGVEVSGIRFQRCGGGRHVIRRQKGGAA